ncbi:peptidyl-prolyl cis-trans isomerase [Clostridium thermarum]|uniref:peptidyl-prolyl cis-trans isomerase n=1 Tax=Clostridium thermarum TaxID=1716543 RepID=UPI0013D52603|nr:peptidyl-prolyl cis-trans isomerase [Clostridium thermarum]
MNKVKKILSIAVIGIFTLSSAGCIVKTQAGKDNTVVAKIGSEKIKVIDVRNKMKATEEMIKEQYGSLTKSEAQEQLKYYYENMLNDLAEQKLLYIKAKERNLVPDLNNIDAEVQKEIDLVRETQFDNDEKKLEKALEEAGMTMEDLKHNYRESILGDPESIAAYRVQHDVVKDETVSDEEIKTYYDNNIDYYTTNPGANMYHIIVKTEEEAKAVKEKLDKGEKFEDLAKNNTDSTKDYGGSLGYVEYDNTNYDAAFMEAAKKLEEGQISDPVKSAFGWHIIKVTGVVKEKQVKALDEVKDSIKTSLLSSKQQTKFNELVEEWKKEIGFKVYTDKLLKNIF